jgi:NADH:ubiquinone oxidoreductase subunit 6 (subunit J)
MASFTEIAKFAAADFRYHLTVLSGLVVGFLLLFVNDLPPYLREVVLPALVVYTIGTALIGYIQVLLTASANTKAQAEGNKPRGIKERHLCIVIFSHLLWFITFLSFLVWSAVV